MDRYDPARPVAATETSPKLDGVYARATRDGVFSKSGRPLDVPHVSKRLKRYFRKHPAGALEGELYRKGRPLEEIAGQVKSGGVSAGKLKLYVYPGQPGRPLPIGAVRRVKGTPVKDAAGVDHAYQKAIRQGYEGVVVRAADGRKLKLKPKLDREWQVQRVAGGKRGVLVMRGDDGRPFKVQSAAGLAARAGDHVTVTHSGLTRGGKPRAAVATRIRNDKDFSAMDDQEQIRKDRRALVKGALLTGAGAVGLGLILRKGAGGVVRPTPSYPGGGNALPAPLPRKVRPAKVTKTREVIRLRSSAVPPPKATAATNTVRKRGADQVVPRQVQAADLREQRAWGAHKPTTPAKLAKLSPDDRAAFAKLDARARAGASPRPPGTVTAKEASMADRGSRERGRQELLKFRKRKNFQNGEKTRNVAIAGGALAAGGAAVYAAREAGKASQAVRAVAPRFTPQEIGRAIGADVSAKTRKTLKGYFPTFIKGGQKVSKLMKKHVFRTPASALFHFGNDEQWKQADTRRYGNPLRGAAGMERGYYRKNADGEPLIEDLPIAHAQVLRSAYNKGKKVQRVASRGGRLAGDVVNTISGKPRERDAAGRTKKREWEKSWFKETVKNVATGGALLGGAVVLRKSPKARAAVRRAEKKAADVANRVVPDFVRNHFEVREFTTPAAGLFRKAEKSLRKGPFGNLLGASAVQRQSLADRKALLDRVKAKAAGGDARAARVAKSVARNVADKQAGVKLAGRRQKDAVRGLKKTAAVAGAGAAVGAGAMKLHADQPEQRKQDRGARLRNTLTGAAAGSFLGAGLLSGGKSGFRGARAGALLGAGLGLVTNPKRKNAIEELPTASFATPASRLLHFDAVAAYEGWDVRDPRGRSARVFAPGSRRRERREKKWHERADNERALWKAGLVAAGVAGLAGGAAVGRRFPRKPNLKAAAPDNVVKGVFGKTA